MQTDFGWSGLVVEKISTGNREAFRKNIGYQQLPTLVFHACAQKFDEKSQGSQSGR